MPAELRCSQSFIKTAVAIRWPCERSPDNGFLSNRLNPFCFDGLAVDKGIITNKSNRERRPFQDRIVLKWLIPKEIFPLSHLGDILQKAINASRPGFLPRHGPFGNEKRYLISWDKWIVLVSSRLISLSWTFESKCFCHRTKTIFHPQGVKTFPEYWCEKHKRAKQMASQS